MSTVCFSWWSVLTGLWASPMSTVCFSWWSVLTGLWASPMSTVCFSWWSVLTGLWASPMSTVFQLVVSADGAVGLTYEHCAAEGPPVISLVDHAFSYTSAATTFSRPTNTGHLTLIAAYYRCYMYYVIIT